MRLFGTPVLHSNDHYLLPDENWELERSPTPTTFHSVSRQVATYGLFFSSALTTALMSRLLSWLQPVFWIALSCAIAYSIVHFKHRQSAVKYSAARICIALVAGLIAAFWDSAHAIATHPTSLFNGLQWGAVSLAMTGTACLDKLLFWKKS